MPAVSHVNKLNLIQLFNNVFPAAMAFCIAAGILLGADLFSFGSEDLLSQHSKLIHFAGIDFNLEVTCNWFLFGGCGLVTAIALISLLFFYC